MSNAVLTSMKGLKWDVKMRPLFRTNIESAVSGKETRFAYMAYPLWQIDLAYEVLREATAYQELQYLVGHFNKHYGAFDTWLWTNPLDYTVTDYQFGTRNGTSTQFQLLSEIGGFAQPVQSVNVLTNVKSNGTPITDPADYTINSTGLITLAVPGTAGHVLTWTGTFYYRVRFVDDMLDFNNFMKNLWDLRKMSLQSVKL